MKSGEPFATTCGLLLMQEWPVNSWDIQALMVRTYIRECFQEIDEVAELLNVDTLRSGHLV